MRMSPAAQKRWSTTLITIGVLAWVPYFYLLAGGGRPSLLPYLALHLTGVLSGAWLRRRPTKPEAQRRGRGRGRVLAARIMIILGVLAWAPYFYLTRVAGVEQPIGPFLAAHLTGVLGGAALRLSLTVENWIRRTDD